MFCGSGSFLGLGPGGGGGGGEGDKRACTSASFYLKFMMLKPRCRVIHYGGMYLL